MKSLIVCFTKLCKQYFIRFFVNTRYGEGMVRSQGYLGNSPNEEYKIMVQ